MSSFRPHEGGIEDEKIASTVFRRSHRRDTVKRIRNTNGTIVYNEANLHSPPPSAGAFVIGEWIDAGIGQDFES